MHEIPNNDSVTDQAATPQAVATSNHGPAHRGLTVADFDARIRRYNSDLEQDSTTYRAAIILLAGLEFGHNVERIARRTGYPRPFVSQVARRLTDNGVWNGGVTVTDWTSNDYASGTFWNDVAVAEGKMCRRIATNGQIEWAPAGFWNKSFQFVDPEADKSLSTLYHDAFEPASPAAEQDSADSDAPEADPQPDLIGLPSADSEFIDEDEAAVTLIGGSDGSNGHRHVDRTEIVGPTPGTPAVLPAAADGRATVPALDDLFSNAVWIG